MKTAQIISAFAFASTAFADNLLYPYVELYGVKVPLTGEWFRGDKIYTRARENLPFPDGFTYKDKELITVKDGKNAKLSWGDQSIMTASQNYEALEIEFDENKRISNIPTFKCVGDGTKTWDKVYITLSNITSKKNYCESADVYFLPEKPELDVVTNESKP